MTRKLARTLLTTIAISAVSIPGPMITAAAFVSVQFVAANPAEAGSKGGNKGGSQKSHQSNNSQKKSKDVVVDKDVHVHVEDDDPNIVGGLIVGGIAAAVINEATE